MSFTAVGTPLSARNVSTISLDPTAVGNFYLVQIQTQFNTGYATGISGGNCSWTQLGTRLSDILVNNWGVCIMFLGLATSAGTATATVSFSGTPSSGIDIVAQQFSSGANQVALDGQANLTNSLGTATMPGITSDNPGELYFCYAQCFSTAVAGSTSGYTYAVSIPSGSGNGLVFNPSSTVGTHPPSFGNTAQFLAIAVQVREAPADGDMGTGTDVTASINVLDTDFSNATVDSGMVAGGGGTSKSDTDASNAAADAYARLVTLDHTEASNATAEASTIHATLSDSDASNATVDGGEGIGGGSTNPSGSDISTSAESALIIIRSFPLSYAGDWTGAIPVSQQVITDTDASSATADGNEGFLKADSDSSNAALDNQSVPDVTDTDVCLGSDQIAANALTDTDASGATAEAGTVSIGKSDADASAATADAGEHIGLAHIDTDASNATSEAQSLIAHLSDTESSTASEASTITASVPGADSSNSTLDNGELPGPIDSDHSNAATENVVRTIIIDGDLAHGTDSNGSFPTAPRDADSVTASDSGFLSSAGFSGSDSARAGEQQWVDIPGQTTGLLEAFSVSRAAILNPATGLESAVLQGVRSGTLTLAAQAVSSQADDTEVLTWFNATSASLVLDQAYVPFAVIATLINAPVSSSGQSPNDKYAIPLAVQAQLKGAEVPILISCPARDPLQGSSPLHKPGPRALSIVLYKVRITSATVSPTSYKQGMVVSLAATALLSTTDESSSPLPLSDGQAGQFGRLVSSPDPHGLLAHAPLTATLFGTGT